MVFQELKDYLKKVGSFIRDPKLRFFLGLLLRHRKLIAITIFLSALGAMLEGFGMGLMIPFLEGLLNPGVSSFRSGIAVIDQYILAVDVPAGTRIYYVSTFLLSTIWIRVVVGYATTIIGNKLNERVGHHLRMQVVCQINSVSLSYFGKKRSGEILSTLTYEVGRVVYMGGIVRALMLSAFMLLAYLSTIVLISWQLSFFALAFSGLLLLSLGRFLDRFKRNGEALSVSQGHISSAAVDIIGGIRTITEFGTQEREINRFSHASEEHGIVSGRVAAATGIVQPLTQGIASTALIAIIIVAVQLFIARDMMSGASLIAFVVILTRLLPILQQINTARAEWSVYIPSMGVVSEFLRTDNKPYLTDGSRSLPTLRHEIRFDNVSFAYEPGQPVLEDINLVIPRGQTTALVGASGAGKSTLVDLVARFYDPTDGRVLLDGVDAREVKVADLRRLISVVNQHTFLFNESIRANICYGLDNVPEHQLREAARHANAIGFIEEMPDGFDTILGERGARLSGGQRQRIAIARAILRDPEILILDEATSALDSISEKLIQESLEYLMNGRTVIIIAHRLSTVEHADKVVVLESGRVVEDGSFEELLSRRGAFWKYHAMQYQAA